MSRWFEYRWEDGLPAGKTMVEVAMPELDAWEHPENCAECRGSLGLGGEAPLDRLRDDRGKFYGPVLVNHASIGAIWGGVLAQAVAGGRWKAGDVVPPEIVCLMMVGVKLSRESFRHKTDNIDDAQNYLEFADEIVGAGGGR